MGEGAVVVIVVIVTAATTKATGGVPSKVLAAKLRKHCS